MASDDLPDPETPTTATIRHSGTSTSTFCRLLCRAPRTPITLGRVPGGERSSADFPDIRIPNVTGVDRDHDGGWSVVISGDCRRRRRAEPATVTPSATT